MQEVNIITPFNLHHPFTYLADHELNLKTGDLVLVEVRSKKTYGLVVDYSPTDYKKTLKPVLAKIGQGKLSPALVEFLCWCAKYNMIYLGAVLKMTFPLAEVLLKDNKSNVTNYIYNSRPLQDANNTRLTLAEKRTLEIFKLKSQLNTLEIKDLKLKPAIIKNLISKHLIVREEHYAPQKGSMQDTIRDVIDITLNTEQQGVYDQLSKIIETHNFSVSLLDGVPGSGKTEVYFKLISQVLKENRAVLVLLPEIALSTQWLIRFQQTFGVMPYLWHSNVSKKIKKDTFVDVLQGKVKVMVGTRSALFLPFTNLGLIIIDEEHDSSFKQVEKVIYHARDMGITRAFFEKIPVLLTTATPSLETWYNCSIGKYNYLQLPNRFNQAELPKIQLVDMNLHHVAKGNAIADYLLEKLIHNFKHKQQSLLFLNKRGYSNYNLCYKCQHKIICPKCSHGEADLVFLVAHKSKEEFVCHRCGYWQAFTTDCKACGEHDSIVTFGMGIEKIAEEIKQKIPDAKIVVASSDTINSIKTAEELVNNINAGKVDIVISTQILAKGYHFPNLSLVGIVDTGLESNSIDLKKNEHIWQVLYQVAGRAGREKVKGEVILQSYNNNYLVKSLINFQRDEFLEQELKERVDNKLPPFSRLASLIISSKNETKLNEFVSKLKKSIYLLPAEYYDYIKGPIPALFYKINNRYRYRYLIVTNKNFNIQKLIRTWMASVSIPNNIVVKIDIDPISFY